MQRFYLQKVDEKRGMMTDSLNGHRFIFVGGSPRSGTTLLQNMLDSHPEIFGGPEFLRLPDIIALRNKLRDGVARGWIIDFCSDDDVDRLISSLIEAFLIPLADKYECEFLSEKTPSNVLVFSELLELFPKARFIQIVRDPRAIIASMLQVGERGKVKGWKTQDFTTSILAAIKYVRRCFRAGITATEIAPERVLTVVYERLVSDPQDETKRICAFLGIEWSSQMIRPGDIRHLGEKAISNDVWYNKEMYNRNPETRQIDKWEEQLGFMQKTIITAAFRNSTTLAQFGYDLSGKELPAPAYVLSIILSAIRSMRPTRWLGSRFRKSGKATGLL